MLGLLSLSIAGHAAELAPDHSALSENLLLWLRTPDTKFDAGSGAWLDASGKDNHAKTVGTSAAGVEYVAGVLGNGSNGEIFGQEFSTIDFKATVDNMLIVEGINGGEGLANTTVITVYSRTMVTGTNASIIRPVGFGSWKLDNTTNNFNQLALTPRFAKIMVMWGPMATP